MGHYPWGFTGVTPNASDNIADSGSFDGRHLVFTDDGALPGAPEHHYAALVGTALTPDSGVVGDQFWGPQPGHRCSGTEPVAPMPSQCDDGPFGRGTGGELTYTLSLPAGGSTTVWLAVAGSDRGLASARQELTRVLDDPAAQLAAKVASRQRLAGMTRLSLPGDPQVEDAVERATWFAAGFPDYLWIFGTDGEYTAFVAVSVGQFEAAKAHLRALRDISDVLNEGSGVVVHESVADGSIWFGHDSRRTNPDGSVSYDFNTDETVKFPSAVALLWRWTGDDRFRDNLYDFAVRNLRYVARTLDADGDGDGWPEGLGNVERSGMGPEKLDNTVYFIRGLYDLADMARAKHDGATYAWASDLARKGQQRFDGTWWDQAAQQYADSLNDPGDVQSFQKHWIGQTPMEAELRVKGQTVPGLAPFDHGDTALAGRENDCFSGVHPLSPGLYHTACGGGANGQGEKVVFGLTTSIQSIGEGNYGRLGQGQQERYTHALAETMFSEPATGGTPDEQPGAMPEIFPSPDQGANIDRCWTCRSMFMQAWGNYGTAWAVVHQWLGVRPDLGFGRLEVVPQVPEGQANIAGSNILVGKGSVDVTANQSGNLFTATVLAKVGADLVVGQTLPDSAKVRSVTLNGRQVHFTVRHTNRGQEILVAASTGTSQHLEVTTA